MHTEYELLTECLSAVRKRTDLIPRVAIVLGSGLGNTAELVEQAVSIGYDELPGFPVATVSGHAGRFVLGYLNGVPVVVMKGRVHNYEGYTPRQTVRPIRLMYMLGARVLLLTNAAGGLAEGMVPGDLMLLRDHISSFVPSPLQGPNEDDFGPRFPDMTNVYDDGLRAVMRDAATSLCIPLREGVYLQTAGPAYETPAEIRMYGRLGADAVGMSTTGEAMAARHAGMRVCAVSCISNLAAGISATPLSHEDVSLAADLVGPRFRALVLEFVARVAAAEA